MSTVARRRLYRAALFCGGFGGISSAFYISRAEPERRVIRVFLGGITRFIRSSRIGLTISTDYYYSTWGLNEGEEDYNVALSSLHQRAAERILAGCLKNGGLYVKLGQGLVVMDHILPKEYINTLRVLQDKCLIRNKDEVHDLFMEDFGKPVEEIFDEFEEEPIAAASLAQVFKAKTKDGKEVAIKAQYIDLQDRFTGDITTVQVLLKVAGWLHPDFDFAWILNELRGTLEKELDFINEGKNSERCAKDLIHFPFVYVPQVLWDLSSTRVLTTEFIDGIKISDKNALLDKGFSLADVDSKLFQAFAEQIFHTGFVHADPHAGNVLVRKGKDGKAELVILDHGLYEEVPPTVREPLRDLWKSIVLNDHPKMKKYATLLGVAGGSYRLFCMAVVQRYLPPEEYSEDDIIRVFFPKKRGTPSAYSLMSPKEKAQLREEIMQIHDNMIKVFKSLPPKYILVSRNINTIRSIARGHGDPVDRYKTMARCATQGAFTVSPQASLSTKLKGFSQRVHFEFKLWWEGVKVWFFSITLKMIVRTQEFKEFSLAKS